MRISTNQFHQQGYSSIQKHQEDILDLQVKLSTGKRVNAPGDDPVAHAQIVSINRTMNTIDQYSENGEYAKSQLVLEETAIADTTSSLQRARELAIQMSNDTYNASNRQQTAAEIGEIINQVRNMMNYTNSEGEKIFAGTAVNVEEAFLEDPNNPGYYTYVGNPNANAAFDPQANYGSRFVQIGFDDDNYLKPDDRGDASRVRITDDGSRVFKTDGASLAGLGAAATPVDNNILNVLVAFKDQLDAGLAPTDEMINDMDSSIEQLSLVRAEIGGRQNRIESQYDAGEGFKITLEERKQTLESQDIVEGITELTQSQNALQMAQQVFSRVQGMSLFDYLR